MDKSTIWLVFFISLAFICLAIELLFVDFLQDSSSDYIYYLQLFSDSWVVYFFRFISKVSEAGALTLCFMYYLLNKTRNSVLCIYITYTATWVVNVLKMSISHPRPFWYDSRIKGLSCSGDFGSPSGHSVTVGSFILFFFFITVSKNAWISTGLTSFCLALLALDRNYLGVHFYFQVVLGYSIALVIVSVFLHGKVKDAIGKTFKKKKMLLAFNGILLGMLLVSAAVYYFRNPYMDDEWVLNFRRSCNKTLSLEKGFSKTFIESTTIVVLSGFSVGLYLMKKKTVLTRRNYIIASMVLFAIGGTIEQIIEYFIKGEYVLWVFLVVCLARFFLGIYASFLVPLILSNWFKAESSDESQPFLA